MKWFKFVKVALQSILKNRMRSLLTMLGVIIGVGSVIALMALGEGSQKDIKTQISSMGTNLLMIHPGAGRSGGVRLGSGSLATISMDDVKALREKSSTLLAVSPNVRVSEQVIAGNANWSTSVEGVSPDYLTIRNYEIASGTFFTERDVRTRAKAAVLGRTVAEELFGDSDPLGARIRVRNVPFKVIGVLAEKGQSSMGNDQDDVIFTPSTTALYRLSDGKTLRVIMASAVSEEKMDAAEKEITQILRAQHKLSDSEEDDFNIRSQTEIINMASQMTGTLTALLSAIAGVSLLVGGIGIMNIMLVSVTERTREIGIRMAVGARGSDIMAQFLVEAIILSLIGGVFGIVTGLSLAFGLGAILGCSVVTNLSVILTAVAFTAGVGVFFGFYPARKAAGLHPIEALRYE
ncbi:putative ABC transport system permease protein [Desulfatibacillum alkenivorans DSM 16219]|jgi:putative ABC transport system permease protein|uniref:Putative ABC transport system permease protein n=1 Tax=Desulfatibacillum alkenivorans DSM 16219 TaxID=1121393 RepID=A0A1M6P0K8_9BACT|nr:ABC transporter permease [Desulfatibacillum alkenivorans]SHK01456.1 putative ABC transport system permease protein [Desulfatibacillum alkenivorans DSM 16219]